ncbi:hypothetical protein HIM_04083 [Hirsutella minnesotensis 3608]|uniref:Rhodopsin domain-containing protein n=1 Tax=Hirsutella minnesotensis 3608 TaxID=1043627 RepID=A0A0F8A628_9HYPO|nr:hypothetical protein HIM_04083 [Hirsutella minnesotensis 3608]
MWGRSTIFFPALTFRRVHQAQIIAPPRTLLDSVIACSPSSATSSDASISISPTEAAKALIRAYYQEPGHFIAAAVVLSMLAAVAAGLRFWTRLKHKQGLRADDWCILPAVLLTIGQGICLIYGAAVKVLATTTVLTPEMAKNPLAAHTDQIVLMSKVEFAHMLMLPPILGLVKLSFLFFYVRLFVVDKTGKTRIVLSVMIALIIMWIVAFFFAKLFECRLKFWAIWGSPIDLMRECIRTFQLNYAFCITDFITDVLVIFFPIPMIWRLKLSRRKKFATSAIFLLGIVAVAASLTRLVITAKIVTDGFNPDSDEIPRVTITTYLYWGMVECGLGVVAACLPSLSFLAKFLSFETIWTSITSVFSNHPQDSPRYGSSDGRRGDDLEARKSSSTSRVTLFQGESLAMEDLAPRKRTDNV